MSNKPTVVLVHGFWGGAAHWRNVIVELARKGYTSLRAVELPLTSLADDAERTRKMIAQQAGPVLLVGRSYGGAVITQGVTSRMWSGLTISRPLLPTRERAPVQSRSSIFLPPTSSSSRPFAKGLALSTCDRCTEPSNRPTEPA